jgi:hypothetical protein
MPWVRVRAALAAGALSTLLLAAPAASQTVPATSAGGNREIGPFAPDTIGVELAVTGMGELWSLNGGREWLAGGSAGVWWAFAEGRSLVVQFHATEVFQAEPRPAFVNAVVPTVRWRLSRRPRMDVFAVVGVGVSWSDTRVPPHGTEFNYVGELGVAVARRIGRQTHAMAGVRLLHLSNNDRAGVGRNPDIEALGGYAALSVGF